MDVFWRAIFERERLSQSERHSFRLGVSTRLVRELARLKGLVRDDQLMRDSMMLQRHWNVPITFFQPHPKGPVSIRRASIPLMPPKDLQMLQDWISVMEDVALRLGIYRTPDGLKGIYQLLDPSYTLSLFPHQSEIMAYEQFQIKDILQAQIDSGTLRAMEALTQVQGYTPSEARHALSLSRATAPAFTRSELEHEKALMILRIEEVIQQAKTQADIRAELQALKLLTFVQGLHHARGDDTMQELIKVITQTGRKFELQSKPEPKLIEEPEEE